MVRCNEKAKAGTFQARDNIAVFIQWARALGLDQAVLFETDDLVKHNSEKQVLYCLMEVARVQKGLEPPKMVQLERTLDAGLHARADTGARLRHCMCHMTHCSGRRQPHC